MSTADKVIDLTLLKGSIKLDCVLSLWHRSPENGKKVRLSIACDGILATADARNFFEALREIRRKLEREGYLIRCYGASKNVFPSGMCLSMGKGLLAYKSRLGRRSDEKVYIFDSGPDCLPSTVLEQEEFARHWRESIQREQSG